jgi:hypothetical protein
VSSLCCLVIIIINVGCNFVLLFLQASGVVGWGGMGGGVIVTSNFGRIQIVFWGDVSGANVTKLEVCHVTVSMVLACFGWDFAMTTQLPIGKFVGNDGFVMIVVVGI